MADKTMNARLQLKHDTEAHWILAINFIPKSGELIVYDSDTNYNYPRLKVGDGVRKVSDLPFVGESPSSTASSHIVTTSTNLSASDIITINISNYNLSSLSDGQVLFVFLQSATSGNSNLSISYSLDGSIYNTLNENLKKANSSFSAIFSAGSLLELLYYNNAFHIINAPLLI